MGCRWRMPNISLVTVFLLFYISAMDDIFGDTKLGVSAGSIEKSIVDSAPKAEMFDFFHVMPEGNVEVMTEWDLLLTMDQFQALYKPNPRRGKRKALNAVNKLWTDCYVYYEITESLDTTKDRAVIKEAFDEWTKYTCLTFIESHTKKQRILFKDGGGCYSKLGMQDKPQPLVLARGCRTKGIIAHEIGHAVGWIHEHMRPDRDDFISVNLDAIPKNYHDNYQKYEPTAINTYDIPYDYTSLMHYGNSVFKHSLLALDPKYQDKLGQRTGLSFKDIKLANVMYGCADMFCDKKLKCKGEGFQLSNDHKGKGECQCWCDSGNVDDPLVLCSERKEPPIPPQPSIMPTVMPKMKCTDVRNDCRIGKQLGHCMTKMKLMARMCSKTCNFCDKEKETCMDYDKGCPIMAAAGVCKKPGFQKPMSEKCKASCGLCPKPPDPCQIQKEMMGDLKDFKNSGSRTGYDVMPRTMTSWILAVLGVAFTRFY